MYKESMVKYRKRKNDNEFLDNSSQQGGNMEQRKKILDATLRVFNRKGLKFTMDDIAAELSMSKKTIYTVFHNKETLFFQMVDYCFDSIKEGEQAILTDTSLKTVDKIRKILGVLPEGYKDIDFRNLYQLKDKYPKIYHKVEERLETGWENTIALFQQAMEEGEIRPVNIIVIKTMLEATIEQFFQRDVLITNGISYGDALQETVDIIVNGIVSKE